MYVLALVLAFLCLHFSSCVFVVVCSCALVRLMSYLCQLSRALELVNSVVTVVVVNKKYMDAGWDVAVCMPPELGFAAQEVEAREGGFFKPVRQAGRGEEGCYRQSRW